MNKKEKLISFLQKKNIYILTKFSKRLTQTRKIFVGNFWYFGILSGTLCRHYIVEVHLYTVRTYTKRIYNIESLIVCVSECACADILTRVCVIHTYRSCLSIILPMWNFPLSAILPHSASRRLV